MAPQPTTPSNTQPEQPAQAHVPGSAPQDTVSQQPSRAMQNMEFQEAAKEEPKMSMRGGGCIADCCAAFLCFECCKDCCEDCC
ncbi:hypothetical protein EV356DRAFT_503986 [Viridothelium virens]|uniref:Uncharacterized protein n=1 Tax=Viridothelium virens TaxID=1048519 RepID=A0A6A6H568_VIRVR|nr:hypothetical protein EV356DRAFT_503986 [Viridothelium virens]